jgi:hypothetical protein
MPRDASELARRLARDVEAVCRHYLSNGRRQGRYWTVGDVRNTPGRSMFVRLSGPESGPGAVGHWTDAASAEYGDLLDVIRESCGLVDFRDVADEARRFLSLPRAEPHGAPKPVRTPVPAGSPEAAQRLFAMSQPIRRTLVETYLRNRGIETMLSLRCALPAMPMAAALSANHLAALLLPPTLRRLYIARDADAAGDTALATLTERAEAAGIEALALSPRMGDFNENLRAFGFRALRTALRIQLAPRDVVRFMHGRAAKTG